MKIFISVVLACFMFACHGRKVDAPKRAVIVPSVTVSVDTLNVKNGAEFWLEHMIENGDSVYAVAARLNYDTAFVEVLRNIDGQVRMESGSYLGATGHLTAFLVGGMPGNLGMAYSKQGEQPGSSGNGLLWRVRMKAKRAGITTLTFDRQKSAVLSSNFLNGEQQRLPAEFIDASLEIAGAELMRIRLRITP